MRLVIVIGVVMILVEAVDLTEALVACARGDVAIGRVVELEPSSKRSYHVVAEWRDSTGAEHLHRSDWSSSDPGYAIGGPIRILYAPRDPDGARILSFWSAFGSQWLMLGIGGVLLWVGIGGRRVQDWIDRVALERARKESAQPEAGDA